MGRVTPSFDSYSSSGFGSFRTLSYEGAYGGGPTPKILFGGKGGFGPRVSTDRATGADTSDESEVETPDEPRNRADLSRSLNRKPKSSSTHKSSSTPCLDVKKLKKKESKLVELEMEDKLFCFPSDFTLGQVRDVILGLVSRKLKYSESLKVTGKGSVDDSPLLPFDVVVTSKTLEDARMSCTKQFRKDLQPQQLDQGTTNTLVDFYLLWVQREAELGKDLAAFPVEFFHSMTLILGKEKKLRKAQKKRGAELVEQSFYSNLDRVARLDPLDSKCICIPIMEERNGKSYYSCAFVFNLKSVEKRRQSYMVLLNGMSRDEKEGKTILRDLNGVVSVLAGCVCNDKNLPCTTVGKCGRDCGC